jgi:uncharacterized membrane protein
MSAVRWAGPALLVLGGALVAAAVGTGGAHVELVLVFPVFVGGASALFLGGIVALFLGFVLLPLAFGEVVLEAATPAPPDDPDAASNFGGMVLIGPFPILFGSWKNARRSAYWAAAVVGLALLVLAIFLVVLIR